MTQKLAMPVVHESLYVYAADKSNGGMALAEKWCLTLVQLESQPLSKSVRRKSFLTSVASNGLLPEAEFYNLQNEDKGDEDIAGNAAAVDGVGMTKEDIEEQLPSVVVMEDDYFQTDAEEKAQSQIQTLADRTQKIA